MSGSSGGGGSSGTVDYPDYMKDAHKQYMNDLEALLPAPNPFTAVNAPAITPLTNNNTLFYLDSYLEKRIDELHTLSMSPEISVCLQQPQFYSQVMQMICMVLDYVEANHNIVLPTNLAAHAQALAGRLTELDSLTDLDGRVDFETTILPRFHAGMRDINAVQMSTFVTGRAVMEGVYASKVVELREQLKSDVWKMQTEVQSQIAQLELDAKKTDAARIQNIFGVIGQLMNTAASTAQSIDTIKVSLETSLQQLRVEMMKIRESSLSTLDGLVDASAGKSIELSRMKIVAAFEQSNMNIDYDEKQYRWDLENFQYLANMLAAIGSGTASAGGRQTSKFSSTLGGALSGAAAGATMSGGNPVGAGIGAILGAGASLLS